MRTRAALLSLLALGGFAADATAAPVTPVKLTVRVTASAVAGQPFAMTVTAVDRRGRPVTGYRGTVGVTSSDAGAVLPRAFRFTRAAAGSHAFTGIVLKTAGRQSLVVADSRRRTLGRTALVAVTPAPAAALRLGAPATVTAGQAFPVTATATDAFGNALGDVTATTTFSISPDGGCVGATCRITGAGAHTVTATNGAAKASKPMAVTAGPPAALALGAPGKVVAGDTFPVSASATDAFGNPLGDVTATTTFSLAPDGACVAGGCRATVKGPHVVSATNGAVTASADVTVTAGAPVSLAVTAPSSAVAGQAFAPVATGTDSFGNTADLSARTTFTLAPDGACSGASCTATVAGAHAVTGAVDGLSDAAAVTVGPGPLHHLVLTPATAHVAGVAPTATAMDFTPQLARAQEYAAQGFDAFGNSRGDVTGSTTFTTDGTATCADARCSGVSAETATVTGTSGTATGTAQLVTDPVTTAYSASCQGENFDVNGSIADGCEVAPTPSGNTTQATARDLLTLSCFDGDSNPNISGTLASDARTHTNPVLAAFNAATGSAPKWWKATAGGGACQNDLALTLAVAGSANPACYKLTVITNVSTYTAQTNAGGVAFISQGSGSYGDGTTIFFKVEKTCSLPRKESVSFTVTGHL